MTKTGILNEKRLSKELRVQQDSHRALSTGMMQMPDRLLPVTLEVPVGMSVKWANSVKNSFCESNSSAFCGVYRHCSGENIPPPHTNRHLLAAFGSNFCNDFR